MSEKRFKVQFTQIYQEFPYRSIPFDLIAPHEEQALINHRQTLDRLNDRGGCDCIEIYGIMNGIDIFDHKIKINRKEAIKWLKNKVEEFESAKGVI